MMLSEVFFVVQENIGLSYQVFLWHAIIAYHCNEKQLLHKILTDYFPAKLLPSN